MQNPEAPYKNTENLDQKPHHKPPKSPAGIIQTLIATKDIIDGYIEDWEMREYAWNSNDPKYNDFPIDPGAFPSGTIDEGVMAVTDIIESVKLAKDLITNKDNIRSQMWEAITNVSIPDDIWNMVSDWFSEKADKYAEGGDMAEYTAGRDVAAIALIFFDPSSGIGKLLTKVLGKLKKVGSVITDNVNDGLKKVILRTEKGKGPELKRDLDTNPELKKLFDESDNPERLASSWEALDNIGVDDAIRKNPDYLKNVDDYAKRSGKSPDEVGNLAKNNENGIEQFLDELEDTPASGHWDENPFDRGKLIEDDLGQNLPETFKTIDKYDDVTGEVTSIKSLDLDAKTYQTPSKLRARLNRYVDELDNFIGHGQEGVIIGNLPGGLPINSKSLELAIPRSATGEQLNIINEVIESAANKGIELKIIVHP